jgi:transposase
MHVHLVLGGRFSCEGEAIAFVLGHALYMRAIHGGKAKNDRIDAHKIAALLRGGMLPQAYVYPKAMRATRDLMRRRNYLRKRAELLAHIQNTNSQYNLAAFGARPARPSERAGLAEHFGEASVRKSIELDMSLIDHYDRELPQLEDYIEASAHGHDPVALALLAHHAGNGTGVGAFDPVRDPVDRALCPGAGLLVLLPAGEAGEGIGREALGPRGCKDR